MWSRPTSNANHARGAICIGALPVIRPSWTSEASTLSHAYQSTELVGDPKEQENIACKANTSQKYFASCYPHPEAQCVDTGQVNEG